ncbi:hypothetical protein JYG23_08700 [Sedimentibacter sp. zth1]|uniref:hypothetical protein n=1 Tax=Sedimentibacter sp. zth1 TaxID=2816908 RepID=UPI001A922DEE|nr:hypothetical protein [Sedimentibacter sp. zth1]QSX04785.1 hypothetical protein JYG23_08700 [Sedimentibacter sp. zth1]
MFLLLIAISVGASLYGGYNLVRTLIPKTNMKELDNSQKICSESIICFSSIATNSSYDKYLEKINNTSEDDYINDILSQIYICAKICDLKFKTYKRGLYFSLGGLVTFVLLITIDYFL